MRQSLTRSIRGCGKAIIVTYKCFRLELSLFVLKLAQHNQTKYTGSIQEVYRKYTGSIQEVYRK